MRGIIVQTIDIEDVLAARHLHAVEGYAALGMFDEAEEELRQLHPRWRVLKRELSRELRDLAAFDLLNR